MDGKQWSNLFCEAQRNKKITTAGCRGHQRTYKFPLNKNNKQAVKIYPIADNESGMTPGHVPEGQQEYDKLNDVSMATQHS